LRTRSGIFANLLHERVSWQSRFVKVSTVKPLESVFVGEKPCFHQFDHPEDFLSGILLKFATALRQFVRIEQQQIKCLGMGTQSPGIVLNRPAASGNQFQLAPWNGRE
jgi:hypothetical protein